MISFPRYIFISPQQQRVGIRENVRGKNKNKQKYSEWTSQTSKRGKKIDKSGKKTAKKGKIVTSKTRGMNRKRQEEGKTGGYITPASWLRSPLGLLVLSRWLARKNMQPSHAVGEVGGSNSKSLHLPCQRPNDKKAWWPGFRCTYAKFGHTGTV